MGIQDRDYYRQTGYSSAEPMKIVYLLIILNVILWLGNAFITPGKFAPDLSGQSVLYASGAITETLSLHLPDVYKPWLWWKFITYGFAHSSESVYHLLFNMLGLFFLGRYVEDRYGRNQFLGFYLASIIFGGIFWVFCSWLEGSLTPDSRYSLLGASGGVTATVILFAITYPRVTLILFPIPIPIPAWLFGLFLVGSDMYGAISGHGFSGGNVAYSVHLGSAAFAALYYFFNWNFSRLGAFFLGNFSAAFAGLNSPAFTIHRDERYEEGYEYLDRRGNSNPGKTPENHADKEKEERLEAEMRDEVDRILKKISQTGRGSLTRAEERTLQAASEYFQSHRH